MEDAIYHYKHRLEVAEKNLQKAKILQRNKTSITDYVRTRRVNGLSIQRQCKYIYTLKKLGELAGQKSFEDLTREDMIEILDQVKMESKKDGTPKYKLSFLRDFQILWRGFIAWVHGVENPKHEGYPRAVSWFEPKEPKNELKPTDLITSEDEEHLLNACLNLRDRAILAVLSECGLRPSELLSLKIGNVKFVNEWAELSVGGKTGVRPAFSIKSMPHLSAWLNVHPRRNNPGTTVVQNVDKSQPSRSSSSEIRLHDTSPLPLFDLGFEPVKGNCYYNLTNIRNSTDSSQRF